MSSARPIHRIGVIGGGAWGTTLAVAAHRAGRDVMIWAREADVIAAINDNHENTPFLPGVRLPTAIRATATLSEAVAGADAVVLAVPAQFLRRVLVPLAGAWPTGAPAVICAKGIERKTGALLSEVIGEELPFAPVAVLSGPSFAAEVARELPTALTLACPDAGLADALAAALGTPHFRLYLSDDIVGVETGGAVKNVLAIACGIIQGRGLGDNARAALITRGLAEIARLAAAKGAQPETVMGLSGLGDLVLTCSAMQSRNFSLGVALGEGKNLDAILGARQAVTEGVAGASSVTGLARRLGVEMPICQAVNAVLTRGADIDQTIAGLLARPRKAETAGG